ncbi:MAG: RIP metalloprotease RseP [Bacillota bacterium]
MTLLASLLVFGVLILFHEFGHFAAAKAVGIRVDEFSIGFGPLLFGFRRGETKYSIRLIPALGYVKMAGEAPDEVDLEDGYMRKPLWGRALTSFAGPLMNFVLTFLLFTLIFAVWGVSQPLLDSSVIAEVIPESPAAAAGLQSGDRILSIDGRPVSDWNGVVVEVSQRPGSRLEVLVEREGQTISLSAVPQTNPQDPTRGWLGIVPQHRSVRVPLGESLRLGIRETWSMLTLWIRGLASVLARQTEASLMGPVGITQMIGQAAQLGLVNLLYLAGALSANLGLINLLPLPALDGSHLAFMAIELVRGRPIDPRKQSLVHVIGFAILLALIAVVTYRDILRIGASIP